MIRPVTKEQMPAPVANPKPIAPHAPTMKVAAGSRVYLAYHEILPTGSPYLYAVSSPQIQNHLKALATTASGRSVEITFDDGHRSNFELAFPMLEQFGQKATFFLLAEAIGNRAEYLSWRQARALLAAGHSVQSHGWSHRLLTQCAADELSEELSRSKKEIEDRLGEEVSAISAPGGRWNRRVAAACAAAGYKFLFHSNPWSRPGLVEGIQVQGRLMVTNRMSAEMLQKQMQLTAVRRFWLAGKYAAKERLRAVLGERLYHRFWCWAANWKPEDGMEVQVE